MAKSSQTVRLLCMRDIAKITSDACYNFLKDYRKRHPELCLDEPSDAESVKTDTASEVLSSNTSNTSKASSDTSLEEMVEAACRNADMCCPKKRKKKVAACHQKVACPKKRKRRSCPQKPACPKRRKKPACAARRKPACAARRKPACPKKRKPACRKKPACAPKRRPRCPKKRVKCSKPGPVMNNGYLNFVRAFRRKHCGLKPQELIQLAARAWCALPEEKKDRYRRMACKVTKNCRHKHRRVCTGKK